MNRKEDKRLEAWLYKRKRNLDQRFRDIEDSYNEEEKICKECGSEMEVRYIGGDLITHRDNTTSISKEVHTTWICTICQAQKVLPYKKDGNKK